VFRQSNWQHLWRSKLKWSQNKCTVQHRLYASLYFRHLRKLTLWMDSAGYDDVTLSYTYIDVSVKLHSCISNHRCRKDFSQGANISSTPKLREKHFSAKELIANYQISKSRGSQGLRLPTPIFLTFSAGFLMVPPQPWHLIWTIPRGFQQWKVDVWESYPLEKDCKNSTVTSSLPPCKTQCLNDVAENVNRKFSQWKPGKHLRHSELSQCQQNYTKENGKCV